MNEPVWSITQVNAAVLDLIEQSFMPFWLCGEVGTLLIHRSGHVYMTLKDENCQLRATWFGGAATARGLGLAVGMKVEAFGKLSAYPARGDYQFNIRELRPAGQGALLLQFEQIKRKLEAEGLFAPERKRALPTYPTCVGVITAAEGAAVRDFIRIALNNYPAAKLRIYPAAVQGARAVPELMRAIDFFNRSEAAVDAIVLTRGGGSIEDLWPFNDEALARKIAASRLPVVSAVGHEIDFTIADFAADFRAPTPSAAAEQLFGGYAELKARLDGAAYELKNIVEGALLRLQHRLHRAAAHYIFREPAHLVRLKQQQLDELERRAVGALANVSGKAAYRLEAAARQLAALDPGRVLARGYAIVRDANGKALTEAKPALVGADIKITLAEGGLAAQVIGVDA